MRADRNQIDFANWLMKIGNGLKELGEDLVRIPNKCIVENDIINDLYNGVDLEHIKDVCILSSKNVFVDDMNKQILNRVIPGDVISKFRLIYIRILNLFY